MRLKFRIVLPTIFVIFLSLSATATAATISVGELAPGTALAECTNGPYDVIPGGTATDLYRVPTNGVITSWSTNATAGAGQELQFKVYRPVTATDYLVVGSDGPRPLIPSIVNTFSTDIPVQTGDLIGDNDVNASSVHNACEFESGIASDLTYYASGNAPVGTALAEEGSETGERMNVKASLQPAPTIGALSPTSGSTAGGTSVLIAGTDFEGTTAVKFGSVSASSFTVNSESGITATAPPGSTGTVAVSVTTVGGTATSTQEFTYVAPTPVPIPTPTCKVPNLTGKKLKGAKKKVRAADCKVGHVGKKKGVTAKTGKVVKQSPKPGTVVAATTKVFIKLG